MEPTNKAESLAGDVGPISPVTTEPEVVELRPIENFRVCPACLVTNSADDLYCTACGAALAGDPEPREPVNAAPTNRPVEADSGSRVGTSSPTEGSWPAAVAEPVMPHPDVYLNRASELTRPVKRRWPLVILGIFAAAATAVALTFVFLWHSQSQRASRLETTLNATRADLAQMRIALQSTQERLLSTTSLADKRRTVLLQAQDVLGKVDSLLSSVDNIQARARDIQSQRDSFTADSDTLTSTMITLGNYLIRTDPGYIDGTYLQGLISDANYELSVVRDDEASLGAADGQYNSASSGFGTKADAFSSSVRNLQKQLKGATTK